MFARTNQRFVIWRVRIALPAGRQGSSFAETMYTVYILKSLKDGNLYIGRTNDFNRRIKEHNSGKVSPTKSRIPFVLLEKILVDSEGESVRLELEYKKGYKREEIKRKYGEFA